MSSRSPSPPRGGGAAAADLLSAALSDADRRDRETMNLKMEIAHLRERLLLRVGGDSTAAALEAEAFALKQALADAQSSAARAQQSLQSLDAKYAKALSNLVKMDQAWKTSAAALQASKKDVAARDESLRACQRELAQLQTQHAEDAAKRQTLVTYQEEKIATLEAAVRTKETELATHVDQLHKFTLKTKELESELEATRRRHESTKHQTVASDEFEALQKTHQHAMETNATLRGETNALREERTSLQSQLQDTKASLTAAMAKFLQLKEENATLEVRVAAANEKSGQSERDAAFYKSEVDRIQSELTKRDEELLQMERDKQVLELQLMQQQRRVEDAVQVRDHEAKRLELKQELTWKDREFALEKEVRSLKQQCETLQTQAESARTFHIELCKMLNPNEDVAGSSASQDLKRLIEDVIAQNSEAAFTAEQQQKQVNRLEKELAKMKSLAEENANLKAEYEKTRLAMERIVGRKSKATANTQRFTNGTTSAAPLNTTAPSRNGSSTNTPTKTSTFARSTSYLAQQRRPGAEKENNPVVNAITATVLGTKRKLDLPPSVEPGSRTPTKDSSSSTIFSPRSKRVIHVASRYMQAASKR